MKNINFFSHGVTLLFGLILLFSSCSKTQVPENYCDDPNHKCNSDTILISNPIGNAMPVCPLKTVVNLSEVNLKESEISFGETITFDCTALSPANCVSNKIYLTRSFYENTMEILTHLEVDTCQQGCTPSFGNTTAQLFPINFTWTWEPKTKGLHTLHFINVYGEDFHHKIKVN
jgi:hypothetical protein